MDGIVRFTRHAVDRYILRARPALSRRHAEREMQHLATLGQHLAEPPAWSFHPSGSSADGYLLIGDLVFPIVQAPDGSWVALSCITRGELLPSVRAHRNAEARDRRRRRHHKPRPQGRPQRPPEPLATVLGAAL